MRRIACLVTVLGLGCGGEGEGEGGTTTGVTGATGISATATVTVTATMTEATPTSGGGVESGGGPESGGEGCTADAQCPSGQHCAPFTGVCLGEDACVLTEDCEGGKVCVDGMCVIGGDCGAQSFELTAVPPNVMIVLDRSGSMDGDVQDSNKTRWEVAKDAIGLLVDSFDADIRFGLVTYSACTPGEACTAGKIVVPVGNLAAGPITGFLGGKGLEYLCNSGDPETSTGNTLYALIGEPSIQDPERGNAVLLITDGNENDECKTVTDAADAAGKLLAQSPSVKTFAVGFSDGVIDSLADVATQGGTGVPYNANNPATLEAALNAIAGAVASCDFVLGEQPDDPGKIYVFFNDDPVGVPLDALEGWTYDPITNTIHFHGQACAQILAGTVVDIDVVFGCNVPVPG